MAEHLGVSGSSLSDGTLSSKSWYFICSHRRWSDLLCSRRCLHDHPHQTLKKEPLQYTPQVVKTVAKEIMKVESSKQIGAQTCCSVRLTAKVTLVLQPCQQMINLSSNKMFIVDSVKKNSEPWILLLRKNEKQPEPWCLDCTLNLAILTPRGKIDSLRRKHAHRLIIATAKKFSCSACEESQRRRLRPVAARVLHEPGKCLQVDQLSVATILC